MVSLENHCREACLRPYKDFFYFTYEVRSMLKTRWWFYINFLVNIAMKEGDEVVVLYKLHREDRHEGRRCSHLTEIRAIFGRGNSKKATDSFHFDNKRESILKINSILFCIAFGNKSGFKTF